MLKVTFISVSTAFMRGKLINLKNLDKFGDKLFYRIIDKFLTLAHICHTALRI